LETRREEYTLLLSRCTEYLSQKHWRLIGNTINLKSKRTKELVVKVVKFLMKSYDSHPKERRILIRYEDLINQTFDEVKKIYEFLEIDIKKEELEELIKKYDFKNIPESEKGKGQFRRFATPGKWKENFTEEEKKTVENMIGDTLRKMGY